MPATTVIDPALNGLTFRSSAGWQPPTIREYLRSLGHDVDAASWSFTVDGVRYTVQWNGQRYSGDSSWTVYAYAPSLRTFANVMGVQHDVAGRAPK